MARNESVTVRPHRGTASNHAAPLDAKGSAPEIANDVFAPWQAANPQLISVSLDEAAIVAITDAAQIGAWPSEKIAFRHNGP